MNMNLLSLKLNIDEPDQYLNGWRFSKNWYHKTNEVCVPEYTVLT